MVNKRDVFPDNWIYIHDPGVRSAASRTSRTGARTWCRTQQDGLGLEYFCFEGDELWTHADDDLIELATRELEQIGLVDAADVVDGAVVRMPKAYPVYDCQTTAKHCESCGRFWTRPSQPADRRAQRPARTTTRTTRCSPAMLAVTQYPRRAERHLEGQRRRGVPRAVLLGAERDQFAQFFGNTTEGSGERGRTREASAIVRSSRIVMPQAPGESPGADRRERTNPFAGGLRLNRNILGLVLGFLAVSLVFVATNFLVLRRADMSSVHIWACSRSSSSDIVSRLRKLHRRGVWFRAGIHVRRFHRLDLQRNRRARTGASKPSCSTVRRGPRAVLIVYPGPQRYRTPERVSGWFPRPEPSYHRDPGLTTMGVRRP